MTYWQKGWDLYICHTVARKDTYRNSETGNDKWEKQLAGTSYLLMMKVFICDHPEKAYEQASALLEREEERYREDNGDEISIREIGIYDLDLVQLNSNDLPGEISKYGNITLDAIDTSDLLDEDGIPKIRKKEELSLFDKYYNAGRANEITDAPGPSL